MHICIPDGSSFHSLKQFTDSSVQPMLTFLKTLPLHDFSQNSQLLTDATQIPRQCMPHRSPDSVCHTEFPAMHATQISRQCKPYRSPDNACHTQSPDSVVPHIVHRFLQRPLVKARHSTLRPNRKMGTL